MKSKTKSTQSEFIKWSEILDLIFIRHSNEIYLEIDDDQKMRPVEKVENLV